MSNVGEIPQEIWALQTILRKLLEQGWDPLGGPTNPWSHEKNQELIKQFGCMLVYATNGTCHLVPARHGLSETTVMDRLASAAMFNELAQEAYVRLVERRLCSNH